MLLDYLERLDDAGTIEDLWDMHLQEMLRFGFNRLFYGFTRFRTANSLGDHQDWLILTNHPKDYTKKFVDGGLYLHAPMVKWSTQNVGACSWGWMAENMNSFTKDELEVVEFNKKMGIVAGYSISFRDMSARSKGAIGLAATNGAKQSDLDKIWKEHGRIIVQMNNAAHQKIISLPYSGLRKNLTQRQRETLEWVGDGKTTQDIATIMGLKAATVEKHLRLAREALDVETTAQAVLKASFQNQIFVIEA